MESSSPSDSKPKISLEERDALKVLIQNIGRIYPHRRFVALLVATLIYVERIEGRTRMKEGVNMTCSVFVGGVILASRVGSTPSSLSPQAAHAHPPFADHAGSKIHVSGMGTMHQHPIEEDPDQSRASDALHPQQEFLAPRFPRPIPPRRRGLDVHGQNDCSSPDWPVIDGSHRLRSIRPDRLLIPCVPFCFRARARNHPPHRVSLPSVPPFVLPLI